MCIDENNIAMLKELMGDDFSTLVDTFVKDSANKIKQMLLAVDKQDPELLRQSAPGLTGSALNLSANKLTELCLTLENMGHQANLSGASEIIDAVEQEYRAVTGFLVAN